MHVVDLSHTIETGMPVYPGDEGTVLRRTAFVARDGFAQTSLAMTSHAGTHVDAAAHVHVDAPGLDRLGPDNFTGWGAVVDLTSLSPDGAPARIGHAHLAHLADMDGLDFVLLRTGWDRFWRTGSYYSGFPTLSETACRFLGGLQLKGVGLDTPSPDPVDSTDLAAHHILTDHGLVIVENLCNLDALPPADFIFCCLPLRLRDGEASPVRAVGLTLG
jgi:Predicted metal-dependent hydrolase